MKVSPVGEGNVIEEEIKKILSNDKTQTPA
jgi:hypothetical protein